MSDRRLLLGQFTRRHRFDDDRLQFRIQSLDQLVDGDSSSLNRHLGPRPTDDLAEFLESACSGGCWVASRRRRGRGLILGGERGKVAGEKGQADGVFKQVRFRVWRQVNRSQLLARGQVWVQESVVSHLSRGPYRRGEEVSGVFVSGAGRASVQTAVRLARRRRCSLPSA